MQFRKKPVVIEAWQLPIGVTEQAVLDAPSWVRTLKFFETGGGDNNQPFRTVAVIDTLEGVMRAEPLDWIIRGIKGEMYPCKPDIFAATYETAAAPAAQPADSAILEVLRELLEKLAFYRRLLPSGKLGWLESDIRPAFKRAVAVVAKETPHAR